jgi:hypothetical protein
MEADGIAESSHSRFRGAVAILDGQWPKDFFLSRRWAISAQKSFNEVIVGIF